ncbi:MAG: hypothetical protein A2142_09205 [candidate division Zixibacteria bacterium RBG_16_48_11]|nr:MAG: hypothetical protein A2142_09205 [candidate division Zixibacteria bacterium RBG_16_48_11]
MPRKFSKYSLLTLSSWLWPELALASTGEAQVSSLAILFGLLTAVLALGCFYLAWKVYSFLKKGELAFPWQMLGFSFFLLGLAQLLEMATLAGWVSLTPLTLTLARFLALTLLALGLHRTTKILG